jgi:hypothetical protein
LVSRSVLNNSVDIPSAKKIMTGLAITSNNKQEKVPSIPCKVYSALIIYVKMSHGKRSHRRSLGLLPIILTWILFTRDYLI